MIATIFLNDCSDHGERSDHMETTLSWEALFTAQIYSFPGYNMTSTTATRTAKKSIGFHL